MMKDVPLSAATETTDARRSVVLDVLRVAAISLVLARHSLRPFWKDLNEPLLPVGPFDFAPMLLNGWIGVDLFFVLSGFLITHQLIPVHSLSGPARQEKILKYLKKRFFRIAPAYYLVLTLTCLGLFAGFPDVKGETGFRYLYHLLFLNDYLPSDIVPAFWSLAIEMKFYLLVPLLVLFLLRCDLRKRFLIGGGLLLGVIGLRVLSAIYLYPDIHDYNSYFPVMRNRFHLTLDGLLWGMICALFWNDTRLRAVFQKPQISAIFLASGVAVIFALIAPAPIVDIQVSLFDKTLLPAFISAGFAMILLGALGRWGHYTSSGKLAVTKLALLSYSIYLIHMQLVRPAYAVGETLFHPATPVTQWLATLLPLVVMSVVGAAAIYYAVERPFIRWAKR